MKRSNITHGFLRFNNSGNPRCKDRPNAARSQTIGPSNPPLAVQNPVVALFRRRRTAESAENRYLVRSQTDRPHMKRLFPLFSALAAVPFVALLLVSLGYTLGEASLLAVMFLPGLFAFRHFLPQIRFAERRRGALQLFYLTGAVLTFEYVALMLTNFYLRYNASVWRYDITMPDLLQNPLFILLLLAACALPMHWIELRCNTQPARDRYVEFISDRRRVRLETERISYLESNDSEVWIHTSTGESLRTKTKISQWEQQLDDRFLRIHRSYIVNADRVARHTAGAVVVDGRTLEVSRKYRDSVRAAIPESAPSARVRHISNDKPS